MNAASDRSVRAVGWKSLTASAVILVALIAGSSAWSATRQSTADNHFLLHMEDYAYAPSHMVWRVGDTITVTLVNDTTSHPGKPHEWMVGRIPNTEDTPFGKQVTDGFETPFFDGVEVDVLGGKNVSMLMAGGATLTGKNPMSLRPANAGPMEMEAMTGFMPVVTEYGDLTISFKVPDKPGEWTYGCFQQTGQHFLNGMRGTITVIEG